MRQSWRATHECSQAREEAGATRAQPLAGRANPDDSECAGLAAPAPSAAVRRRTATGTPLAYGLTAGAGAGVSSSGPVPLPHDDASNGGEDIEVLIAVLVVARALPASAVAIDRDPWLADHGRGSSLGRARPACPEPRERPTMPVAHSRDRRGRRRARPAGSLLGRLLDAAAMKDPTEWLVTQPVTLINAFEVPPAAGGAFIAGWEGHGISSGPGTGTRRRRCTGRHGGTVD
jgi:hypothetical protein